MTKVHKVILENLYSHCRWIFVVDSVNNQGSYRHQGEWKPGGINIIFLDLSISTYFFSQGAKFPECGNQFTSWKINHGLWWRSVGWYLRTFFIGEGGLLVMSYHKDGSVCIMTDYNMWISTLIWRGCDVLRTTFLIRINNIIHNK